MMSLYKRGELNFVGNTATLSDIKAWLAEQGMIAVKVELLSNISSACVGEIAMGYRLDAQSIGDLIYQETGMTQPELYKAAQESTT
jgi:hypothetical protein